MGPLANVAEAEAAAGGAAAERTVEIAAEKEAAKAAKKAAAAERAAEISAAKKAGDAERLAERRAVKKVEKAEAAKKKARKPETSLIRRRAQGAHASLAASPASAIASTKSGASRQRTFNGNKVRKEYQLCMPCGCAEYHEVCYRQ